MARASTKAAPSEDLPDRVEPDSRTQNSEDDDDEANDNAVFDLNQDLSEAQPNSPAQEPNGQKTDEPDVNAELQHQNQALGNSRENLELHVLQQDCRTSGTFSNQISPDVPGTPPVTPTRPVTTGFNTDHINSTSPRNESQISPYTHSIISTSESLSDTPYPSYIFPSAYYTSPDAQHGLPDRATHQAYTNLQEACLIRHFIKNLAQLVR